MRFFIEEAKCNASEFAKQIGLIPGAVVASVRYKSEEGEKWLHCMEFDGLHMFYSTGEDLYEMLLNDDITDEEVSYATQFQIKSFHGVSVPDHIMPDELDLDCFYEDDIDDSNKSANGLLCYILVMILCRYDVMDECISLGIGKYSDELDVEKLLSLLDSEC